MIKSSNLFGTIFNTYNNVSKMASSFLLLIALVFSVQVNAQCETCTTTLNSIDNNNFNNGLNGGFSAGVTCIVGDVVLGGNMTQFSDGAIICIGEGSSLTLGQNANLDGNGSLTINLSGDGSFSKTGNGEVNFDNSVDLTLNVIESAQFNVPGVLRISGDNVNLNITSDVTTGGLSVGSTFNLGGGSGSSIDFNVGDGSFINISEGNLALQQGTQVVIDNDGTFDIAQGGINASSVGPSTIRNQGFMNVSTNFDISGETTLINCGDIISGAGFNLQGGRVINTGLIDVTGVLDYGNGAGNAFGGEFTNTGQVNIQGVINGTNSGNSLVNDGLIVINNTGGNTSIQGTSFPISGEGFLRVSDPIGFNNPTVSGLDLSLIDGVSNQSTLFTEQNNFNGITDVTFTCNTADCGFVNEASCVNLDGTVNQLPIANNDDFTVLENESLSFNVLANDSDPDGGTLGIVSINGVNLTGGVQSIAVPNGIVDIDDQGNLTFTPNEGFNGSVSFPYVINDGTSDATATADVTFTVDPLPVDQCDAAASGNLDSDGDGISDICDLDDDNDGILDVDEQEVLDCTDLVEPIFGANQGPNNFNGSDVNNPEVGDSFLYTEVYDGVDAIVTIVSSTDIEILTLDVTTSGIDADFQPQIDHVDEDSFTEFRIDFVNTGTTDPASDNTYVLTAIDNDLNEFVTFIDGFSSDVFVDTPTNEEDYVGLATENGFSRGFQSNGEFIVGVSVGAPQFHAAAVYSGFNSISFRLGATGGETSNHSLSLVPCVPQENWVVPPVLIGDIDTDGDGIINRLDIDSDNDGCNDATEGDALFTLSDVNANGQLLGSVDPVTGVPTITGSPQQDLSSTNSNVTGVNCDDDGDGVINSLDACNGFDDTADNDSDGIPDACDLDDDNDGILDALECPIENSEIDGAIDLDVDDFDITSTDLNSSTVPHILNSVTVLGIEHSDFTFPTSFVSGYDSVNVTSDNNITRRVNNVNQSPALFSD